MILKRYYVKATGSVCYDRSGITFPDTETVNFNSLLSGLSTPKWENQFDWSNQPAVLSFSAEEKEAREINRILPVGLIVVSHWSSRK